MPKARKTLISLEDTPYYHCVSRCVRRSFLCGEDKLTGANYEHRRQWVEKRLISLSGVFAIDLCAYAVMSNHTHIVLRVNKSRAESWTNHQVIEHWHQLYAGNYLSQRFMAGQTLGVAEKKQLDTFVQAWRERLFSISWFMRNLNEHIARQANREDNCTGRFWEGRFKSQALLDDKALAACMAYVDLNPVRACMADTPETSDHTSVKERIRCTQNAKRIHQPKHLLAFVGNPRQNMPDGLPFELNDYLALLDQTGKVYRNDKRGSINQHLPPLLERLSLTQDQWKALTRDFEKHFSYFVGSANSIKVVYQRQGYTRSPGLSSCLALLSP
ncbi:transposase [Alkalimarinus alittae]|uniref:Transposase n=1 Tax=Alkalimarinus alittae TaxID=2961619 RepID=A0ABY6N4F8_9ALTE|nr:transposase [Alkalimarinus alittae]UZE96925.1 transposase [Alkalimarinus alittae]